MGFAIPPDHRIKLKENEKDKYLDLAGELKKLWNMKVTIIPIVVGAFGTVTKGLIKGLENLEIRGRVEIIHTTERPEKSPGDLMRLAVTQTLVKNHQLKLMWKKSQGVKTQQNSKCRLCSERDETINHIICECSKLALKGYQTKHDWVWKVIHWEMCKKFKSPYEQMVYAQPSTCHRKWHT